MSLQFQIKFGIGHANITAKFLDKGTKFSHSQLVYVSICCNYAGKKILHIYVDGNTCLCIEIVLRLPLTIVNH